MNLPAGLQRHAALAPQGDGAAHGARGGVPQLALAAIGVDYGTKLEVYDLVREEAARGRTFLWYTTETEELKNCDRVYIFRNGVIVAHLTRDELTEERVIHSSFAGTH